ncbi:DUF6452 family protein [Chitinophaga sp. 30R24]|uniref:DUF6452 family protein n=1 Tax=Chitinophaga sp. 30R24 TaxID=3248838 RepID=UPI003B8F67D0
MKTIYQILLTCFIFAGIIACENETKVCDQTLSNDLHVHFKRDSAGVVRDTIMPKVTAFALGRDSIYKSQPLGDLFLQLSPKADSSQFYLKVDSALVADTITLRYTRQQHFISAGCGFGTYFTLDTVIATRNTIDSVLINNKSVISSNDTHLTLFFFNQ